MSAFSRPHAVPWPELDAQWVRRWVQKTQDLVLVLDANDRIAGALHDGVFADVDVHHWIGQALLDVVSPDTRPKVPMLLANDTARDEADDRWRHLNLLALDGTALPILARYMRLPDPTPPTRAVICRDLRATQDLNQRHLMAFREIEQTVLNLRDSLQQKELEMARLRETAIDVQRLVEQIKKGGFDQVIRQATHLVQRQCLQALLDQALGNPAQAARLAGIDPQTWAELAQAAGL